MSKTTITICGEECVILPAPKGAFIFDNSSYPDFRFVEYVAISMKNHPYPNIWGIYVSENGTCTEIQDKQDDEELRTEVCLEVLKKLQKNAIHYGDDLRKFVVKTYQAFKSHGTPMDLSAIEWFREKFKEHNITKADFDVFA